MSVQVHLQVTTPLCDSHGSMDQQVPIGDCVRLHIYLCPQLELGKACLSFKDPPF
jgi:hypothetical protein